MLCTSGQPGPSLFTPEIAQGHRSRGCSSDLGQGERRGGRFPALLCRASRRCRAGAVPVPSPRPVPGRCCQRAPMESTVFLPSLASQLPKDKLSSLGVHIINA